MSQYPPRDPRLQQEVERAIAAQKSYVIPALISMVLYTWFYIPGLIANLMFFKEARKARAISGVQPSGYGCLLWLLIGAHVILVVGTLSFVGCMLVVGAAATETTKRLEAEIASQQRTLRDQQDSLFVLPQQPAFPSGTYRTTTSLRLYSKQNSTDFQIIQPQTDIQVMQTTTHQNTRWVQVRVAGIGSGWMRELDVRAGARKL